MQKKTTAFLSYFAKADLELTFEAVSVRYDGGHSSVLQRGFVNRHLGFEVKLRSVALPEWNQFLNEARLSALALSIFLAAAVLSNPTPPTSVGTPLKLLVLDDVLIGLDLSNRLPVLDLIEREFIAGGWQVLLFTFDRAWYEVARQRLRSSKWCHYELFTCAVGNHEQPVLVPDEEHLYRALAFLEIGQVKAASVCVRTAFEILLKFACQQLGVPVKFHADPRKVSAADLWSALKSVECDVPATPHCAFDSKGRVHWWNPKPTRHKVVPTALVLRVEHAVSWVLNPLSHSQTVDRYRAEIEDATYAIDDLEDAVQRALALRSAQPIMVWTILVALLKLRIAQMGGP